MTLYAGDEFYDDDVTSGIDDEADCTWCAGDALQDQCDDPLGCPGPHLWPDGGCPCRACNGTGLRSQQTVF